MVKPRILISYFFGDDMIPLGHSCAEALRAMYCSNGHAGSMVSAYTQLNRLQFKAERMLHVRN